jgi:hypothetical protein
MPNCQIRIMAEKQMCICILTLDAFSVQTLNNDMKYEVPVRKLGAISLLLPFLLSFKIFHVDKTLRFNPCQ